MFYNLNRLIRLIINMAVKKRKVIVDTMPPHIVEYEESPFIRFIAGADVKSNFEKKFSIIQDMILFEM
jgi:hypothetical protein